MLAFVDQYTQDKVIYTSPQGELQKPRSFHDMQLAARAAIRVLINPQGGIPSREEAAEMDLAWHRDVNFQLNWLQFLIDQKEPIPLDGRNLNGKS